MMLVFDQITHRYSKSPSVSGININIAEGQVVSLLGPSGCGKSTILRLAAGLERPEQGSITLDGGCVASDSSFVPPENRGIGFVFQDSALFPHMTVSENILYGLEGVSMTAMDHTARQARRLEVLEQVDLIAYADAMPHELSGGQQQRVALARALAPNPKLILLDEPYSGLDSRLRERIRDDMLHVLKETGTAVLLVTHDSEEAMFMSDYIYVMQNGKIIQGGRPIDLYCRPGSAFVAEFFGEVNLIDGPVINGRLISPFGEFDLNDVNDDAVERASLVIRHEALIIGNGEAPNAEVMETRLLGRYSLIHLSLSDAEGEEWHLHARVPGLNMIQPGQQVTLSVDPAQVFVFAHRP
jgi:iron(III) transport system ATP-binding protein